MHATDVAVELAGKGVPFRTAYRQVADGLDALGERSAEASLAARTSPGATADMMLGAIEARLRAIEGDDRTAD
jgi:argininosuccinate lyase